MKKFKYDKTKIKKEIFFNYRKNMILKIKNPFQKKNRTMKEIK